MSHPLVVNVKVDEYDVFCGRPGPWGNPFVVGTHGTRRQCCAYHIEWLQGLRNAPDGSPAPSKSSIRATLRGQRLGCFCVPKQCHADYLAEIANHVPKQGLFG